MSEIFLRSCAKLLLRRDMDCPACGAPEGKIYDRRFLVFSLVRCPKCLLLSRRPADTTFESERFYQRQYIEESATDLPSDEEIGRLLASGFADRHSYRLSIQILEKVGFGTETRLLDFGCNWGYGSWQFQAAGMKVTPVEISRPRAEFARKHLGLRTLSRLDEIAPGTRFDVFFSSHVLEHVADVGAILDRALPLVRPGGIFACITPNGSADFRQRNPALWHMFWGRKHSNFLDDVYWRKTFADWTYAIFSRSEDGSVNVPWEQLSPHTLEKQRSFDLGGEELIVLARKQDIEA